MPMMKQMLSEVFVLIAAIWLINQGMRKNIWNNE